ncbi:MAG: hypothetical protein LBI85_04855 [Spirochaetaceae bacterium]|jgi:hypothetical protein|nr:hypothetical protein [Spirochaetaceae bacterium]
MNMKKYAVLLFLCTLVLSCVGNTKDENTSSNNIVGTSNTQQADVAIGNSPEAESIRDLLHKQHELATKWNKSVSSVNRVHFGVPGGDNWLVEWNDNDGSPYTNLTLHLIRDGIIIKDYEFGLNDNKDSDRIQSRFDIMKDIPGTHIGNGTSSVGDFNGDGMDEIFQYAFGGNGNFIVIIGYDAAADDIVYYCRIPFWLIDPENGPAPVEFMTYKGMEGFKVYFLELTVAGGPTLPPEPTNPDNGKWVFYSWDAAKMEYARIEEVVE